MLRFLIEITDYVTKFVIKSIWNVSNLSHPPKVQGTRNETSFYACNRQTSTKKQQTCRVLPTEQKFRTVQHIYKNRHYWIPVQSTSHYHSLFIHEALFINLHFCLLVPWDTYIKILHAFLVYPLRATCPVHRNILHFLLDWPTLKTGKGICKRV